MAGGLTAASGAAAAVAALAVAASLSGCAASNALGLARKACQHVDRSIALYHSSEKDPGTPAATREQTEAVEELRDAMPIAATASGEATQWQALTATLSESTRVPESGLLHALESQCAAVSAGGTPEP